MVDTISFRNIDLSSPDYFRPRKLDHPARRIMAVQVDGLPRSQLHAAQPAM